MDRSEEYSRTLLTQLEKSERQARLRAVLLTIIPAICAIVLLVYAGRQLVEMSTALVAKQKQLLSVEAQLFVAEKQLSEAESQVQDAQGVLADVEHQRDEAIAELDKVQAELNALRIQEADTNKRLEELTDKFESLQRENSLRQEEYENLVNNMRDVSGSAYSGDPLVTIKNLANTRYYMQSELLAEMLFEHTNARWNPGGYTPEEGFDSLSFATFILEKYGLLPGPGLDVRYMLRKVLPPVSEPQIGDIVFYDRGYAMFYFEDENGVPFVVGMTPLGVLALKPDFLKVLGYGTVRY